MSDFVVVKDPGAKVFCEAMALEMLDLNVDALWFRFDSAFDMYSLAAKVLPLSDAVSAYLLVEVLPGPVNPKISEFQGAFGRTKLLAMNMNRTFRKRISSSTERFFIDGAPASVVGDWKMYLKAVYNSAAGLLISGDANVNLVLEEALQKVNVSTFFRHLIDGCGFIGVFMENHIGTRSIVFFGHDLISKVDPKIACSQEPPDTIIEAIRAYGDHFTNRRLFQRVLRASLPS
jgi:hypothetical protein